MRLITSIFIISAVLFCACSSADKTKSEVISASASTESITKRDSIEYTLESEIWSAWLPERNINSNVALKAILKDFIRRNNIEKEYQYIIIEKGGIDVAEPNQQSVSFLSESYFPQSVVSKKHDYNGYFYLDSILVFTTVNNIHPLNRLHEKSKRFSFIDEKYAYCVDYNPLIYYLINNSVFIYEYPASVEYDDWKFIGTLKNDQIIYK